MTKTKGPWLVGDSIRKYKNGWLDVVEDQIIHPNGQAGSFTTIRIKPGVSVLAIDDEHDVYLTAEYRYAIEQESIEAVSGAIEPDETPAETARRELREELGIEAETWIDLGVVHPLTSLLYSPAQLFVAKKLSFSEPDPDESEIIRLVKMKLSDAVNMVIESKITHAPSCVLILKASHVMQSEARMVQ